MSNNNPLEESKSPAEEEIPAVTSEESTEEAQEVASDQAVNEVATEKTAEASAVEVEPAAASSGDSILSEPEASAEAAAEATGEASAEKTAEPSVETPAPAQATTEKGQRAGASDDNGAGDEDAEDEDENEDGESNGQSFEELLNQYDQFRDYRPGEIITGTVVSVGEQEIVVDVGARVEGTVPTAEFMDQNGQVTAKERDEVQVMVLRFSPDGQYIPLSHERARMAQVWDKIEELANTGGGLDGVVIEKVKGGFIVDVGVRAFLPTSQATLKPQKDYQDLIGQKHHFSILKIQRRRGNLILSRKELLASEHEDQRKELFEKLHEAAVLEGTVKNITDYGAFIDLGGLDGLLHISDMSWGRINHPKDLLEVDQKINVKVLRFDRETEKVSLGLKQCTPDPWLTVSEQYPPGTSATGKVLNLTSYGAFVELEPGVEGMIHVSEMSWTKKIRNPAQVLTKGEEVAVRVLDLDSEKRRVSLSLKQTDDNPWDTLAERFPVGSKVKGKVRNITEFGAFVEIEEGIDGLVHISDFSWGERNSDPNKYVKKGEEVEVVVLAVDMEHHKVSLGMKQLGHDPWLEFTKSQREGNVVTGPITNVTEFGVFVKLSDHVEGLARIAELELDRGQKPGDVYQEGNELKVMITKINNRDRKVDLSVRKINQVQERQTIADYNKNNNQGGATMGDIMSTELRKLLK